MLPQLAAKIVIFQTNAQFVGVFSSVSSFPQVLGAKIGKPPIAGEDYSKLIVEIAFGKIICTFAPKKQAMGDIAAELAKLHILKGADYSR